MKKYLLYLVITTLFASSCHHNDNSDYNRSWEICEGVFVENYTTFGMGAGGGSMLGECLTDSSNFRVFVRTYDEGFEGVEYKCYGDSLIVKFYSEDTKKESLDYYSLNNLKSLKNFSSKPYFKFRELIELSKTKSNSNHN